MTALATIADQSSVADGVRGWLFVAAVIVIGAVLLRILTLVARPHGVPVMGDDLSTLDRLDRPRCHLRCGLAGTVTRTEREDLGGQNVLVCVGHADEGTVRGWWAA